MPLIPGAPWGTSYYAGGATTTLPPFITDVALGGHAFMIDWSAEMPLVHRSIPILRQQQDTSDSPGEQSINSEGLWRRVGESWHVGAGQERFDREDSQPFRFRRSQGVDVWNKWELSLLHDTELYESSGATNQRMAVAGNYLYMVQGTALKYTTDLVATTTVTGTPGNAATAIASNGWNTWTAHGVDGIYMTTRGAAATVSHITGTVGLVAYVKNRVMAAAGPSLYDVTTVAVGGGGALPTALFTHGNTDWNWVALAESQGFIYAAGYSGDKSIIYSLGITTDGTALASPVVAGPLPDGEIVTGLYGYLGRFLAVGTNKGFRLALVSDGGGLTIGGLVTTPQPVTSFEGQDSFIWFNWSGYDTLTTGLGRMDTNQFSNLDKFVPAYASDLMVEGTENEITSIVTFLNRRVFAVTGVGIHVESEDELVEDGYLDTGGISYGITELKTALFVDLQVDGKDTTASNVEIMFSTDGNTFVSLAVFQPTNNQTISVGESVGNEFELRLRIYRDTTVTSISAAILSWLLRVQPRPLVTNMIFATVYLAPEVQPLNEVTIPMNTMQELDFIEQKNKTKEIITFQHNKRRYSVVVDDYEMVLKSLVESVEGMSGFNASCLLKLKRV